MTVGRLQMLVIGIGYLTLLATIFFTLFLSSRLKSVFASAITALIFCILPIFLSNFWGGSLAEWICAILPSGGTRDGKQLFICTAGYPVFISGKPGVLDALCHGGSCSCEHSAVYHPDSRFLLQA